MITPNVIKARWYWLICLTCHLDVWTTYDLTWKLDLEFSWSNLNSLRPSDAYMCVSRLDHHNSPAHNKVVGGYIGFTPSVNASVPRPSRITCPLCTAYSSGWIHFIFIHLTKQLQKVCCLLSFLQNFKISIFGNFFQMCNFDFVLFSLGIWCESLVWVIMGRRGVSQNAGVLVVLVGSDNGLSLIRCQAIIWTNDDII